MPLVLRIAALVLESTESTNSPLLGESTGAAQASAERPVPLWLSQCMTRRTTAKEAITQFLSTVEKRMRATLCLTLPETKDQGSSTLEESTGSSSSPKKRKKSRSTSPQKKQKVLRAKDVDWALCLRDVKGHYYFCGDSHHYGKSKLINVPFLTEVAVKSHKELQASRESLHDPTTRTERVSETEGDEHPEDDSVWLDSTSAALRFAEEKSLKFALVGCAVVPLPLLHTWNSEKKKIPLYARVLLPHQLVSEPLANANARDRAATIILPEDSSSTGTSGTDSAEDNDDTTTEVQTRLGAGRSNSTLSMNDETAAAAAAPPTDSPTSVVETGAPSLVEEDVRRPEDPASGGSNGRDSNAGKGEVPPPQVPHQGDYDAGRLPQATTTGLAPPLPIQDDATRTDSGAPVQSSRRTQLATHATTLTAVGSLDPVPALSPTELQCVWRRSDVTLDGVGEAERQQMTTEEDTARLRLAKAHLLYEETAARYAAMFGNHSSDSNCNSNKGVVDKVVTGTTSSVGGGEDSDDTDGTVRELLRQRALLKNEIKENAKAERECEKLSLLVEFYDKEVFESKDRIRRLTDVVNMSTQ